MGTYGYFVTTGLIDSLSLAGRHTYGLTNATSIEVEFLGIIECSKTGDTHYSLRVAMKRTLESAGRPENNDWCIQSGLSG